MQCWCIYPSPHKQTRAPLNISKFGISQRTVTSQCYPKIEALFQSTELSTAFPATSWGLRANGRKHRFRARYVLPGGVPEVPVPSPAHAYPFLH